jgi:hypothetical protein
MLQTMCDRLVADQLSSCNTTIAGALNEAGYRPPRVNPDFRAPLVAQLQRTLGIAAPRPRVRKREDLLLDEWWPAELVHTLGISKASLHHWISLGLLQARQFDEPLHRWVIWADEAELERLRQYHQRNVGEDFHHRWTGEALEKQS